MANHKITIHAGKGGAIGYSHPELRATRNDTITWVCDAGPFAVDFGNQTPFLQLKGSSKKGILKLQVRRDAAPAKYKYLVAVAVDGAVVTDDPVIIIEFLRF